MKVQDLSFELLIMEKAKKQRRSNLYGMQPPSHSTAELYAALKAAWAEYKDAKRKEDKVRIGEIKQRIKDLQKKLDLAANERDFEQAV